MGWTYNTVDPNAVTNAPTITAVGFTFCSLSLIALSLRLYVRVWMIKAIGIDDFIIAITWVLAVGFTIVTYLQTRWGLGLQHLIDMPGENIFNFGLLQFIGAPFYILSILGFKLSLLCSFLRFSTQKAHRISIYIIIALCCAQSLTFLMGQINLCTPVKKQWDPNILGGSCIEAVPFYFSMASTTIVLDVLIMLTPFPILIKSQIQTRKKIILLGLFSLGSFITIIQIVRIVFIKTLVNYIDSSQLIMWSMVENNLGIIVACIPPLSPLVKSVREKSKTSKNRSKGGRSQYALQSISRGNNRHINLGSGADAASDLEEHDSHITARGDKRPNNSSEEIIIMSGIQKTTEVHISNGPRSISKEGRYWK